MRTLTLNSKLEAIIKRRAAKVCSAFCWVAMALAVTIPVRAAPSIQAIQAKVTQADKSAQFSATGIYNVAAGKQVVRLWRNGVKRRMEWVAPDLRRGDVLVDDGQNTWLYLKAENSTVQTKSVKGESWSLGSGAQVLGTETLGGRPAWKVKSGPRTWWIDVATGVRLKAVFGNGFMMLQNFQPGAVSGARFTLGSLPKAKVQAFDGELYMSLARARGAAPWIKVPGAVPAGFSLESALVSKSTAWLRYTNGKSRFSLFLQPADAEEVAPQHQEGGYFWKKGGIRYFATGVTAVTAKAMAGSVP